MALWAVAFLGSTPLGAPIVGDRFYPVLQPEAPPDPDNPLMLAAVELELSDRDEDTIAGVVLSELGRRPQVGDRVTLGELSLEILKVRGNRILNVRATANPQPPAAE